MKLSNLHTHCCFCDGVGEPEAYIKEAIKKGFVSLGFSSHAPVPFETSWTMAAERINEYLETIESLKMKYSGQIEIFTGLEIDYFDGDNFDAFKKYNLDYNIGSIHFLRSKNDDYNYSVDGNRQDFEKTLNECFEGDIKKFIGSYCKNIIKMLKECKPDVLGHFDVFKKNNADSRYFSEYDQWYKDLVFEVLNVIKESGTIVEVNTGGISRGYIKDTYPSKWILQECCKLDIPVTVTSDAHSAQNVDGYFDLAFQTLKEAGYTGYVILSNGKWKKVNL